MHSKVGTMTYLVLSSLLEGKIWDKGGVLQRAREERRGKACQSGEETAGEHHERITFNEFQLLADTSSCLREAFVPPFI